MEFDLTETHNIENCCPSTLVRCWNPIGYWGFTR